MKINNLSKIFPYLFLIFFYSFLYFPIINLFFESFSYNNKFSFQWFKLLLKRSDIIIAFFNSFFIAYISIIFAIILSLFGIYYLFLNGNSKFLLRTLKINILIPEIILAISLLIFYTKLKIPLGIYSILIPYVTISIGYIFPIIYQKWMSIDPALIRAAYDLGASNWFIWKTIIIPILQTSMLICKILGFILLFDDYLIVYFCGSPNFTTLSTPILSMLRMGVLGEIKALSVILILISLIIILLYLIFSKTIMKEIENHDEI